MFQNYPVKDLINEMSKYWSQVKWKDVSNKDDYMHESGLLKLNCDKALSDLYWHPTLQFNETVKMTVEWYRTFYENEEETMYDFSINQINEYTDFAKNKGILWANS